MTVYTKRNMIVVLVLVQTSLSTVTALAQPNGPLRVHPDNPRYFTDNSGRAILLTAWGVNIHPKANHLRPVQH